MSSFVAVVASIPRCYRRSASTALPSVEMPSFPVVEFPTIEVPVYNPPASGYSQSIADSVAIGGELLKNKRLPLQSLLNRGIQMICII